LESDAIAIAHLQRPRSGGNVYHFVARGENGGARTLEDTQPMAADLPGQGHFGVSHPRTGREELLARPRFLGARHDALATAGRAAEGDALSVDGNVLDHHYRIGAGRHSRAGHDLHALARADHAIEAAARLDFASAAQRGARSDILGAQGEAIADGTIERRIIAIRRDGLGQHASAGARKLDRFRGERAAQSANRGDHFFAGFFEGEHCRAQSQDANCVPEATMEASRSGPVEIMPISTSS
jgi:hypothetical protein